MAVEMIQKSILIVDDEIYILKTFQRLLYNEPYQVFTSSSPLEALQLLEEQAIHLIITDQRMPAMQGEEFIRQVKSRHPHIPCLLITGFNEIHALKNNSDIDEIITKPWNNATIIEKIHAYLGCDVGD